MGREDRLDRGWEEERWREGGREEERWREEEACMHANTGSYVANDSVLGLGTHLIHLLWKCMHIYLAYGKRFVRERSNERRRWIDGEN